MASHTGGSVSCRARWCEHDMHGMPCCAKQHEHYAWYATTQLCCISHNQDVVLPVLDECVCVCVRQRSCHNCMVVGRADSLFLCLDGWCSNLLVHSVASSTAVQDMKRCGCYSCRVRVAVDSAWCRVLGCTRLGLLHGLVWDQWDRVPSLAGLAICRQAASSCAAHGVDVKL